MTDVPVLAFRPVRGDFAVTAFRVLNALAIRLTRRPIDVRPIQRPSGAGARGNRVVLCVVDRAGRTPLRSRTGSGTATTAGRD